MVAVRWCEAEVRDFEWTNTASNLVFAITAYVGWRAREEAGLPFEFVAAELLLVVVFVGSVLFHGTAGIRGAPGAPGRAPDDAAGPRVLVERPRPSSGPWTRPPLSSDALRGRGRADRRRRDIRMVAELCGVHQHADAVAGVSSMAWGRAQYS